MRNYWRLLHREESIPKKYEILYFVLNNIKDKINCDCQPSANQLLLDMLNYNKQDIDFEDELELIKSRFCIFKFK